MMAGEEFRLVEPVPVPDIFVSGLAQVEDIGGGCLRFTFFCRRHAGTGEEVLVAAKLIAPIEAVPPAIMLAARAIGFSLVTGTYFPTMRLH